MFDRPAGPPADPDSDGAGRPVHRHQAGEVIYVPQVPQYLQPLVIVVPLQLLASHIAPQRDCDVDKLRNLAKRVTVE
jgi:glucosamine--fructose-6-phosphate aminotransferase (isomerizing)